MPQRHRKHYSSYSSYSADNSSRSVSPRHHRRQHRHHQNSDGGVVGLVNTFDAPSFKNWVLIPTAVLTIILYIIGFPLAYKLTHGVNRMTTKVYDKSCEDNKDKTNCPYHEEFVEPATAYAATTFLVPIAAFTLCIFVYKIVIFIRNPKVAAGYFLAKGLMR